MLGSVWKNGIPLEVIDIAYRPIQKKIGERLGGQTKLRMAQQKMVRKVAGFIPYMPSFFGTITWYPINDMTDCVDL